MTNRPDDAATRRIAVYTGTFDPLTLGHLNVIERGSRIVEKLVVGIGINPQKNPLFTTEERIEMIEGCVASLGNVTVQTFTGLAVHFVRQCGSRLMLRGMRSLSDLEAEFTMTLANRKLDPDIETIFLMAGEEYAHISSSLIKQIAILGGANELEQFVPALVAKKLLDKLAAGGER